MISPSLERVLAQFDVIVDTLAPMVLVALVLGSRLMVMIVFVIIVVLPLPHSHWPAVVVHKGELLLLLLAPASCCHLPRRDGGDGDRRSSPYLQLTAL